MVSVQWPPEPVVGGDSSKTVPQPPPHPKADLPPPVVVVPISSGPWSASPSCLISATSSIPSGGTPAPARCPPAGGTITAAAATSSSRASARPGYTYWRPSPGPADRQARVQE